MITKLVSSLGRLNDWMVRNSVVKLDQQIFWYMFAEVATVALTIPTFIVIRWLFVTTTSAFTNLSLSAITVLVLGTTAIAANAAFNYRNFKSPVNTELTAALTIYYFLMTAVSCMFIFVYCVIFAIYAAISGRGLY